MGDDSGTYAGEFVEASGAGSYANYALFGNLTATSFSLAMASNVGRAAVSGIQLVSNDHPQRPEVNAFAASDYYVTPGTEVTLSWETEGAETLVLDPGGVDLLPLSTDGNGSTALNLAATTSYTITATNTAGTASAELRVGAGPPRPNILFFLVDDMGLAGHLGAIPLRYEWQPDRLGAQ